MTLPQHDTPLAVRMRPTTLDEVLGQEHLLAPGSPLRRLVGTNASTSLFLWGPPGTGKTTLAHVIANSTAGNFIELSATSAGVKDLRAAVDDANDLKANQGVHTILFVDEVHRFNKAQQDILLPWVERRAITLIGATTENPAFSVINPLLSRSVLLTLKPLQPSDIDQLITRALASPQGLDGALELDSEARTTLVRLAGGDARRSLTYLEEAAAVTDALGLTTITPQTLAQAVDRAVARYDKDGDQHYDITSAFIKSLRGSDPDAALHWMALMLDGGEDPVFVARRLMIHASEDVGMADSSVLSVATAAHYAVSAVGMPEAQIILAHAAIAIATAPKSPGVVAAIGAAMADVRAGKTGAVPTHLRDAHYSSAKTYGHGVGYLYPHDYPGGVVAQQYLPDNLTGRIYYQPTLNGFENVITQRFAAIKKHLNTPQ